MTPPARERASSLRLLAGAFLLLAALPAAVILAQTAWWPLAAIGAWALALWVAAQTGDDQ